MGLPDGNLENRASNLALLTFIHWNFCRIFVWSMVKENKLLKIFKITILLNDLSGFWPYYLL